MASDIPLGSLMAFAGPIFYSATTPYATVREFVSEEAYQFGVQNSEYLAKTGWLLADGSKISPFDPQLTHLNQVLQFGWGGQGAPATYFQLPDLQGLFVRGVSNGLHPRDPDVIHRTPIHPGGNAGYGVGSHQEHALEEHDHSETKSRVVDMRYRGDSRGHFVSRPYQGSSSGVNGANVSGETRPENAHVHWIVKAKDGEIVLEDLQRVAE